MSHLGRCSARACPCPLGGAAVAGGEGAEGVGVAGAGVQEVVGPFGYVGVVRLFLDGGAGGFDVVAGAAQGDRAVREQGPVRARPYGMPTLPGLMIWRRCASRMKGMWV